MKKYMWTAIGADGTLKSDFTDTLEEIEVIRNSGLFTLFYAGLTPADLLERN